MASAPSHPLQCQNIPGDSSSIIITHAIVRLLICKIRNANFIPYSPINSQTISNLQCMRISAPSPSLYRNTTWLCVGDRRHPRGFVHASNTTTRNVFQGPEEENRMDLIHPQHNDNNELRTHLSAIERERDNDKSWSK